MPEDLRQPVSWRSSGKRRMIASALGSDGVLAVMDLWAYCAQRKPDGDLSGLTDREIEAEAGWDGERGALVREMVDARLLDGMPGAYLVHDWAEHQPWCAHAPDRSEHARRAAESRWGNRVGVKTPRQMPVDAPSMRPAQSSNAPSPSPSPSPSPIPTEGEAWCDGKPIRTGSDLAVAVASWSLATTIGSMHSTRLKRLTDSGAVTPEEYREALAVVTAEKRRDPVAFFLGVIKGKREDAANEAAKGPGPSPRCSATAPKAPTPSRAEVELTDMLLRAGVGSPTRKEAAELLARGDVRKILDEIPSADLEHLPTPAHLLLWLEQRDGLGAAP